MTNNLKFSFTNDVNMFPFAETPHDTFKGYKIGEIDGLWYEVKNNLLRTSYFFPAIWLYKKDNSYLITSDVEVFKNLGFKKRFSEDSKYRKYIDKIKRFGFDKLVCLYDSDDIKLIKLNTIINLNDFTFIKGNYKYFEDKFDQKRVEKWINKYSSFLKDKKVVCDLSGGQDSRFCTLLCKNNAKKIVLDPFLKVEEKEIINYIAKRLSLKFLQTPSKEFIKVEGRGSEWCREKNYLNNIDLLESWRVRMNAIKSKYPDEIFPYLDSELCTMKLNKIDEIHEYLWKNNTETNDVPFFCSISTIKKFYYLGEDPSEKPNNHLEEKDGKLIIVND